MNRVILKGNLTRDIEVRDGDTVIGKTGIAVARRKDGTDFFNLVMFGKTAETMQKFLHKGSQVLVEGRIQTGSYTNKEGHKVNTFDIIVDSFEFCGSKAETDDKDGFVAVSDAVADEGLPFI